MESNTHEVSLDVVGIAQSLRESMNSLKPLSGDCCIYRVPPHLRELNKEMYTPQVVSIGPFHHGKEELKVMEEHKRRYLCTFLDRINIEIKEYIEGLKVHEIPLRQSYAVIDEYERNKFMEIMAVDGAFLIEFILGWYFRKDEIIPHLETHVKLDLLLIENQLPFFYLEYLFTLVTKLVDNDGLSFIKIVQMYLSCSIRWKWHVTRVEIVTKERKIHHLLHLLIICLKQSKIRKRKQFKCLASLSVLCCSLCPSFIQKKKCRASPYLATPSIRELHQAGVKLKPISSSYCFSNINFSHGILEIPMLKLTADVENIFRNMQAFEQCQMESEYYISDYICIMDMLINNEEDVKLLIKEGIIHNRLEDDRAAAAVFNNLGKGNLIDCTESCYSDVVKELDAFCKIRRHKWKASLNQKYFHSPWTIISVFAAAFLLLLTIIQTVCSILQVV